jgi:phosphonoacetaldehyde hydrolase
MYRRRHTLLTSPVHRNAEPEADPEKVMVHNELRFPWKGGVSAVILDWAGTSVDYGCMAPAMAFVEVFKKKKIELSIQEARAPMGLMKKDHTRVLLQGERVRDTWKELYGSFPDESVVDELYQAIKPALQKAVVRYADPIPGAVDLVEEMHRRSIAVGSTTGYPKSVIKVLAREARKRGFKPDCLVCASDVPVGRPEPWMCFRNAAQLRRFPMKTMVKVGDTAADIEEGLNAGMWTVAIALSGNEVGRTEKEVQKLSPQRKCALLKDAYERLAATGAHYIADGIWECMDIIDEIGQRLKHGETP